MKQHDSQGTSFKENVKQLWVEIKLFPHGRILHKLKNIFKELYRKYFDGNN